MKKRILKYCLLLSTLFILSISSISCSEKSDKETKAVNDKNLMKIGYILHNIYVKGTLPTINKIDNYSFKKDIKTIETRASSNAELIDNMLTLKNEGAEGIILYPTDPKIGQTVMERAGRLKMKVLTVQNKLIDVNGTYIDKIPYVGISPDKTAEQISNVVSRTIRENNLSINRTGILLLQEPDGTSYETCLNNCIDQLQKQSIPSENVFICNVLPAPDGVIVSPAQLELIKRGNYSKWIIFGFHAKATMQIANLISSNYNHTIDDIYSFSIILNKGYINKNIQSPYFIGGIYFSPEQCAMTATDLMYNWIKDGKRPPQDTYINTTFIKNPKYKPVNTELAPLQL